MKKQLLLVALTISIYSYSQSINYKIVENNPETLSENYITAEIFGGDFNGEFNEAALFVGANGFWKITDRIKAEALWRVNLFNIAGSGFGTQFEAGVFTPLKIKNKTKEVPVILGSKYGRITNKDGQSRSGTTTKFINVNGTYKNQYGARGGLYYRKSSFTFEQSFSTELDISYSMFGVYLGLEKITQAFVKALVGENNVAKYGQGRTRIYIDALLLPVNSFSGNDNFDIDTEGSIGFRAGMHWQVRPYVGRTKSWARPVYSAEIGARPFSGFYVMVSMGLTVFNQ
ncbi:hypothetical protein ACXGQW_04575 [Wenyingzhuangia sp. IMCC45533]